MDWNTLNQRFLELSSRFPNLVNTDLRFGRAGGRSWVSVVNPAQETLVSANLAEGPGDVPIFAGQAIPPTPEITVGQQTYPGETDYDKIADTLARAASGYSRPSLARAFINRAVQPYQYVPPNWRELWPLGLQRRQAAMREMPDWERGPNEERVSLGTMERFEAASQYGFRNEGRTAFRASSVGETFGRMFSSTGQIITGIVPKGFLGQPLSMSGRFLADAQAKIPKSTQTLGMHELAGVVPGPGVPPEFVRSPFVHYNAQGQPIGRDLGQAFLATYSPLMGEGMGYVTDPNMLMAERRYLWRKAPRGVPEEMISPTEQLSVTGRDKRVPLLRWPGGAESATTGDWLHGAWRGLGRGESGIGQVYGWEQIRSTPVAGSAGGGLGSKFFLGAISDYPGKSQFIFPIRAKD